MQRDANVNNKRTSESWSVWMVCSHTAVEWAARACFAVRNVALLRVVSRCPGNNRPGRVGIWYSRFQKPKSAEIVEHSYLVAQAQIVQHQAHKVALEDHSVAPRKSPAEVLHGQIVPAWPSPGRSR